MGMVAAPVEQHSIVILKVIMIIFMMMLFMLMLVNMMMVMLFMLMLFISTLQLERPVTFSDFTRPICLPTLSSWLAEVIITTLFIIISILIVITAIINIIIIIALILTLITRSVQAPMKLRCAPH